MKKILKTLALILITKCSIAQDIDINILQQPAIMPVNSTGTIQVDICNNDGGALLLPAYKIRPLISVPGTLITITGVTGLPAGWTVCSNNGTSIRVSNGTDNLLPGGECRTFFINVSSGTTTGGPQTITATLAFAGGPGTGFTAGAPGSACASGPQTQGNDPANDNSTTSVIVQTVVPVKLMSFTALNIGNNTAKLNWVSSTEQNASHYQVEYSKDGINFSKIGKVDAKGNTSMTTSYEFFHPELKNGNNYYRLKMVDNNGIFSYSSIANLKVDGKDEASMFAYPNPASSSTTLSFTNTYRGKAQIVVTDVAGKRVLTVAAVVNAGVNVKPINTASLSTGTYLINLYSETGAKLGQPQRLMVNN